MIPPPPDRVEFGRRLKSIRIALYGDGDAGVGLLAEELGLPTRTWCNYESGVVIPGTVLLRFLVLTRTHPRWLLDRTGERRLGRS